MVQGLNSRLNLQIISLIGMVSNNIEEDVFSGILFRILQEEAHGRLL